MNAFMKWIDTKVLGREDLRGSLRMGGKFTHTVGASISRIAPANAPSGVQL